MEKSHLKRNELLVCWIFSGLLQQKQAGLTYLYVEREFVALQVRFVHSWAV